MMIHMLYLFSVPVTQQTPCNLMAFEDAILLTKDTVLPNVSTPFVSLTTIYHSLFSEFHFSQKTSSEIQISQI